MSLTLRVVCEMYHSWWWWKTFSVGCCGDGLYLMSIQARIRGGVKNNWLRRLVWWRPLARRVLI